MTYVYCLVRSDRKPSLRGVPAGLPGAAPPRLIDAGRGLWLVVADVRDAAFTEERIADGLKNLEWVSARAIGHEAVVEKFLSAPAVLPMQLFTIFANDTRALAHVAADRRRIQRILKRVEGHVEWGLRLTWDEASARAAAEKAHRAPRGGDGAGGAAYLARKRDLFDVSRTHFADARAEATRLHRVLARHARDTVRRTSTEQAAPGSRLLLDAAYLVPADESRAFRTVLRRAVRSLEHAGVVAALTGPWPAYNFIR